MDRKREKALAYVSSLTAEERDNTLQRIAENRNIVRWVQGSLQERAASYRVALERMVIAAPSPVAVEAERSLTLLQQRIDRLRLRRSAARLAFRAPAARFAGRAAERGRATGISPGSGASARITISPVSLGNSTISRSAAVTSSSSGSSARCAAVISCSSICRRPAERSLIA